MASAVPTDIAVSRSAGTCTITWSDGLVRVLRLTDLRRWCPCATCGDLRAQQATALMVVSGPEPSAELAGMEQVGSYAVRFRWADGHDTGIYSFTVLRRLCDELGTAP